MFSIARRGEIADTARFAMRLVLAILVLVRRWFRRGLAALVARVRPAGVLSGFAVDLLRSREELEAENALLRRQLIVASRFNEHPKLSPLDRVILVVLASLTRTWRSAVLLVKPETVLRWHRAGFRLIWRRKSRPRGRPPLDPDLIALIVTPPRAA